VEPKAWLIFDFTIVNVNRLSSCFWDHLQVVRMSSLKDSGNNVLDVIALYDIARRAAVSLVESPKCDVPEGSRSFRTLLSDDQTSYSC
jgi:hypothetical protein